LKQISGKDFAKLLSKKGWELKRIHGSHHVYTKADRKERISLPIHGNKPLKIGLLKHLMKIANIKEAEL
jgi:predicted RNA binding protein YcfA (HicA-like mRNA interferase family)